jgi:hypothetical protein
VTIVGDHLGNNDLTSVTLAGIAAAAVTWDSATRIRVITAASGSPAAGPVAVTSTSFGTGSGVVYSYVLTPSVTAVVPASGPLSGMQVVTIVGTSFGNNDVVSISLHDRTPLSITWISSTEIHVLTRSRATAGSGPVSVVTASSGSGGGQTYTYNPLPVLSAAVPALVPQAGGTLVTIVGTDLGSNDVTVSVGGAPVAGLTWLSATAVRVLTPARAAAGSVSVQLSSTLFGASAAATLLSYAPGTRSLLLTCVLLTSWMRHAVPVITSLQPQQGHAAGGSTLTLLGTNLGANDISSVTVAGVPATAFTWASATRIFVTAPPSAPATGPVVVTSVSGGIASIAGYTYLQRTSNTMQFVMNT